MLHDLPHAKPIRTIFNPMLTVARGVGASGGADGVGGVGVGMFVVFL